MQQGDYLALGAFIVSVLGTLNSLRKTRVDERSGAVLEIQAVVTVLKEENKRIAQEFHDSEVQCKERIATMQNTIIEQAGQIAVLQRHTRGAGD